MTDGSGWVCVLSLSDTCWKHISEERCAGRDRTMLLSSGEKRRGSKSLRETGKYIKITNSKFCLSFLLIYCVLLTEDRSIQHLSPHLRPSAGTEYSWSLQWADKQHLQPAAAMLPSSVSSVALAESGHELPETPAVWERSGEIQHWGRTRKAAGDK